jgi:glucosamine--fructose-6-phosphate aminotransferase (isomerizing)
MSQTVIHGPYLNDLLRQPEALLATHRSLLETANGESARRLVHDTSWSRIVLTGMGASFHALQPLTVALLASGHVALRIETSELIHGAMAQCGPETLLVVVSQSGASAETLRLLDLNRHATVLAVTNEPNSPLAHRAAAVVLTQAGSEYSVSCKTYSATLMVLNWLGTIMLGRDEQKALSALADIPSAVGGYLDRWEIHVPLIKQRLEGIRSLFLMGRGASLAAVGAGSLIIKEAARFPAEGMSSAAFRHGPLEMLNAERLAIVLTGAGPTAALNTGLLTTIAQQGKSGEALGPLAAFEPFHLPAVESSLLPFFEILPLQMTTLALAAMSGREAGRFEYLTKVTDVE